LFIGKHQESVTEASTTSAPFRDAPHDAIPEWSCHGVTAPLVFPKFLSRSIAPRRALQSALFYEQHQIIIGMPNGNDDRSAARALGIPGKGERAAD
jgi:hypothetical protein